MKRRPCARGLPSSSGRCASRPARRRAKQA
jgi:hypothetical protein